MRLSAKKGAFYLIKYSILIPVFNAEKYLRQCLDSVLSQKCNNYEIVIINDGSSDLSPEICAEYAKKNSHIRFYSEKHRGLLLTRLKLLELAQGEYVMNMDADDYWEPDTLESIDAALTADETDVLVFDYQTVSEKGEPIKSVELKSFLDEKLHTNPSPDMKAIVLYCFLSTSEMNVLWRKCIRKEMISLDGSLNKMDANMGEDALITIDILLKSKNVKYLNRTLYNYRKHSGSMVSKFVPQYLIDGVIIRQYIYQRLMEEGIDDSIIGVFLSNCSRIITSRMIKTTIMLNDIFEWKKICKTISTSPLFLESIKRPQTNTRFSHSIIIDHLIKNSLKRVRLNHFYYLIKFNNRLYGKK